MEKEILDIPKRFVCLELKGSSKVTVIDVCHFVRMLNDRQAKVKLDYASVLLKSAKYFESMPAAVEYMAEVSKTDSKPQYEGVATIACDKEKEYSFLIHAINNITDNYSVHEIESVVFSAETDINDQLIFPIFMHLEKVNSLLNVSKVENNKENKDDNLNKILLVELNPQKNGLFNKETRFEKMPIQEERPLEEQEIDR